MMTKSFENDSDTNHGLNSQRKPEDASFMREAIRLSQLAVEHGNEPFGARGAQGDCIYLEYDSRGGQARNDGRRCVACAGCDG